MDEGDDYVPQMSQMTDYTMMGGPPPPQPGQPPGVPPQQQRYPGQPMNPYEQQQQQHHQMMMMQQQHMHQMGAPVPQQPPQQAAPAQPPPAKKPRGKSKKAQAEAAAAAAAAAAQMDPMASMAAMSNNPMMRQNPYPNQMGMYGGAPPPHYQGTNGPSQPGYRPGPASGGQPQGQYPPPPQSYQQMYHQRAPPPQAAPTQQGQPPGYSPYGYPPQGSTGYPPPPSQQSPYAPQTSHMRHQYPPHSQQQAPPGYWDGYQGYGAPPPQQPPPQAAPVTSQGMQMGQQDQWARNSITDLMSMIASLEKQSGECKARIQQIYHLPRNAAADAEVTQLQIKMNQIQTEHYRMSQQLQHAQWQQQQQQQAAAAAAAPTSSQANQMTPNPNQQVPVHVNQTGSQVQLNITADNKRTLISVYHEGYGNAGSGASSTESKESIVPPEPTPSMQSQEQIPQVPHAPQVKMEPEKPSSYQQQGSYNGTENGVSNPYAQQHQQQMYAQYQQQQHHQNMPGYPPQQHPHQQQQPPPHQPPQHQQPASVPMQHPSQQHPHQQQHPSGYGIGTPNTAPASMKQEPPSMEPRPQSQSQPQPQQQMYPGYPDYPSSSSGYQEPPQEASQPSPAVSDPIMAPPTSMNHTNQNQYQEHQIRPQEEPPKIEEPYEYQSQSQNDVAISSEFRDDEIKDEMLKETTSNSNPPEEPIRNDDQEEKVAVEDQYGSFNNGSNHVEQEELKPQEKEFKEDSKQSPMENDDPSEYQSPSTPQESAMGSIHDTSSNLMEDIDHFTGVEETFGEEEEPEDDDIPEESSSAKSSKSSRDSIIKDEEEDDDDDMSTITKDMSEAPSETNDGFTEPSTPATPLMATPGSTSTKKKSSYRRPVVVSKSKKKKSFDDSDDDDFYPARGKGGKRKGGGGGGGGSTRKKASIVASEAPEVNGEAAPKSDEDEDDEFLMKIDMPAPDPNALVVEKILNVKMQMVPVIPVKEEEVPVEQTADETGAEGEKPAIEISTNGSTENGPSVSSEETKTETPKEAKEEVKDEPETSKENGTQEMVEVEQFRIKWKGRAYCHCEWKTFPELLEIDKRVEAKIKRFKAKKLLSYVDDDEDFNSDFVIVDRVVDHITEDDGQEFVLIKWKSLGYEEVTWEPIESIPADKVELWRQRQVIDPAKIRDKQRPEPEEWKKLSTSKKWKNGNSLREYQFEGVDWLLYCYYNAQNCILADEMGLGKTVQTITFLSRVYDYGIHGPFLVVVPLSTIQNWVREFETWTDMNAIVYHGSAHAREVLQQYEVFYDKRHCGAKNWRKNFVKIDALITTFETVVSDVEFLKKIPWRVCVIDEAHRLKNRNCKLLVNGLLAFRMEHRVLLTGTPLQNNIEELFSLLNFLHPQQFDNSATFLEQFGSCQTDDQVQKLQEILKPMMLRRLKEDVEKSLGPKEETIIEVQLSDMQKKFYRAILERNFSHLCKGTSAPSLMNVMMELRKCCNHPFLINGAEETIMNDFRLAHPDWDEETLTQKALVQASGKVVLIEKLLPKLRKDGHKVLIFSQMVKVLDLLEEFLITMAYPFERIDGNVRGDLRQAAIDRFSKENSDRFVFLLCTRAGGLGINLTAADTVIIFDSDWNPQNDLQAQARCHRIGQKKLVKVYRLITSNTYEREMFDKASLKLGLDKAVLQSTTSLKSEGTSLSKKDVEELLKKGAYGSIMDEDNDSAKFNEEDIETILQRRTQTITLEAGQKGSLFAKATFNSTHNKGDDIDIDDPEFWTKWAEKAQVDVEKATATPDGRELIIEEPRKRTKRFEENKIEDVDSDGSEESGKRKRGGLSEKRKRRRGEDEDGDYSGSYRPDELATSKQEYFKVEKVLAQYGWGRWAEIKKYGELDTAEQDIEHMSRTLLLHCVREFRGDDRVRQFVFQLIKPQGAPDTSKLGPGSMYNQGWAGLPEFNPPSFAMDSAFQRHVHRHANKLMQKIDMMKHLETHIIADERALVEDFSVKWTDIKLKEMPVVAETFVDGWDADCDKCFLIGCWRHGLENYDAIREDENLCFNEKELPSWPGQAEFWVRFRRLLLTSQRSVHDPVYDKLKWSKREEGEFLRVLRSFGVKDLKDAEGEDWTAFKKFSKHLESKTDEECHEQFMCILAMCRRAQGSNDLKPIDLKRAMSIDPMPSRKAIKMFNRINVIRKVHLLAENLEGADLSLCETTGMPSGWTSQHDKELIEICDQYGLESLAANVLNKPAFTKIVRPSETTLIRRVIEIVSTVEAGKWCGVGDVESVNDSDTEEKKDKEAAALAAAQAQFLRLQQQQQQAAAAAANAARKGNRKRPGNDNDAKMRAMQQMLMGAGTNENYMLVMILMQQLMAASGQQNMSATQQQQVNQMLTMLLASAVQQQQQQQQQQQPSTSKASSQAAQQAQQQAAQAQAAAVALAQVAAAASAQPAANATEQQQQQAILEALLTMSMSNPAALAALTGQSATGSSTPSAAKKAKLSSAPKESSSTSSQAAALAAAAAAQQAQQQAAQQQAAQQQAAAAAAAAGQVTVTKSQEEMIILRILEIAGVGMIELAKLNTMSKDAKIPMVHKTTKEVLPESKRPQIRDLTVFAMSNPDWTIDTTLFNEMSGTGLGPGAAPSAAALAAAKAASSQPTPAATPKPATPKVEAAKMETPKAGPSEPQTPSASATCNIKVGGSLQFDDMISVFNRKTGELLAASKWPKANELSAWLDANPDYNVHSQSALLAHLSLNGAHSDRIAGEPMTPATPSVPSTPAPQTPSTSAAAANAQLMALAAAQQAQQQQTPSTSASKTRSANSAAAAAQAAHQEAITKQQLEMLQMQMVLQQYQQAAALQQLMYSGYGMPSTSSASSTANVASMAAMAAAAQAAQAQASVTSTPTTSKQQKFQSATSTPSTSSGAVASTSAASATPSTSAAAASAAQSGDDINPVLLTALMQNPAILQQMMLSDPSVLVALAAQQQQQQQQQSSAKKPKHP